MEQEIKDKMVELRKNGETIRSIMKILNISSPSVVAWHLNKAHFDFKSRADIERENIELRKENLKLMEKLDKLKSIL